MGVKAQCPHAKYLHKIPSSLGSTCAFVQESVALLHSLSGWTKFLHLSLLNGSSNLALDSILLRIDVCFGEGSAITPVAANNMCV